MYFRTDGVILSRRNFGEADKILKIFTKDFGKVSALAKGVRRPRSRKGGHVEVGNWCKVFIARGKSLDLLTEVEIKKSFGQEEFSLEKTNQIYHILELVDALTQEGQKNFEVYKLLVTYLNRIKNGDDFNYISSIFKVKILSSLGFFSAKNLKQSKAKNLLEFMEENDYKTINTKVTLDKKDYLKLLSFLDSIIENITQSRLKTTKFL